MQKTNTELFELLSEPKVFDTAIELFEAIDVFEIDVATIFWAKLFDYFSKYEQLEKWKLKYDIENWQMDFFYESENNDMVYFHVYFRNNYLTFGIVASQTKFNLEKFYSDAKLLSKGKGWRTSTFTSSEMPIYIEYKELDARLHTTYRKFLPIAVDETVQIVAEHVLSRFTLEIQDFIIDNLKPEPPIYLPLEIV